MRHVNITITKRYLLRGVVAGLLTMSVLLNIALILEMHNKNKSNRHSQEAIDRIFRDWLDIEITLGTRILNYHKAAVNLENAALLLYETSYEEYDGKTEWGTPQMYFAMALRRTGNYLEGFVERQEKMEYETERKLENLFKSILSNIKNKEVCENYIAELHEFLAKEYFVSE